jgi:hypothetical protein
MASSLPTSSLDVEAEMVAGHLAVLDVELPGAQQERPR